MSYETYRIADLIDEIAMGPFGSNIKVSCFVDSGVPVLNGSNLEGFSLSEKAFRFVTKEKADSLNKANAHRGDIVITHRGTLGQIAFIPQDSRYDRYVISQSQFRVRCNDKVLPEYLVYYFHTPIGQHKLLSNASQVGVPALARPSSTFQQIEVVLPELSIQKRVVEIISTIQKKIANNQELNDNLMQQAVTIFKSWFVEYSLFDGIEPKEWETVNLEKITSLISRGIAPKYSDNSDQIVINQKCIRNHMIDLSQARTHTPKVINEKWLRFGDLLINSTGDGTLGRAAQVWFQPQNITVDSHVTVVRPAKENLIFYIGLWGVLHEREIESLHTGSTGQTELPKERVKALELHLPDNGTLDRFNTLIAPMAAAIVSKQNENNKLATLRDALLPKLMSGEIDVSAVQL
ncbi:restriction endonuclease subunit S [Oscillibacter sp. PEA192]|uniref:restriction endonuclease subunit S n=1 Tax=Oscillibacter sp. PEA192 TaxID=2109687 RepID=UPI00135C388E